MHLIWIVARWVILCSSTEGDFCILNFSSNEKSNLRTLLSICSTKKKFVVKIGDLCGKSSKIAINEYKLLNRVELIQCLNDQYKTLIVADIKKRRCTPSPARRISSASPATHFGNIMTPSAPFLTWSPILLPPWGPAFLPAALYPAALRSALPGFVTIFQSICKKWLYLFSDLSAVHVVFTRRYNSFIKNTKFNGNCWFMTSGTRYVFIEWESNYHTIKISKSWIHTLVVFKYPPFACQTINTIKAYRGNELWKLGTANRIRKIGSIPRCMISALIFNWTHVSISISIFPSLHCDCARPFIA